MKTGRIQRVTVQVDDLDAATTAFAEAFQVHFDQADHPALGVPASLSSVITIVQRDGNSIPGPLACVSVEVDDVSATLERLDSHGFHERRSHSGEPIIDFHGLPMHVTQLSGPDLIMDEATRFDRAVLAVRDIDAATADLGSVFGIELQIFDVENMRFRVALGEDGIEFIGKMDEEIEIEQLWHWPISGFAVQVADLEETKQRMAVLGTAVSFEFTTPGGMPEVFYGKPGLHGVPITLMPRHAPGSLLEAMGIDATSADVSPTVE